MNFMFSKSQSMLQKSAKDFLVKECKTMAKETENTDKGYGDKLWNQMAELGWMGIGIPEEYSGLDGNFLELMVLIEQMGRIQLPGPFIQSAVSGFTINKFGSDIQKKKFLPDMVDGKVIITTALIKPSHEQIGPVKESVKKENKDCILNGTRLFVPFANTANMFIYFADTEKGDTCFIISTDAPGVNLTPLDSMGTDKLFEVTLENVEVSSKNILGKEGAGKEISDYINNLGAISYSAYLLGTIDAILDMTSDYAKTRKQFQRPIGSFQVIAHQLADMALSVEQVKYLTYFASWKVAEKMECAKEISMAKARASDAARDVSLFGVKIHGGIGIIDEYEMELYFRNAKTHALAFGDADYHREIIADNIKL